MQLQGDLFSGIEYNSTFSSPHIRPPRLQDFWPDRNRTAGPLTGTHEISQNLKRRIQHEILSLVYSRPDGGRRGYNMQGFKGFMYKKLPGPQPVTFALSHSDDLKARPFWVSEKSDGFRTMLYFNKNDGFLIDRKFDVKRIKNPYYARILSRSGATLIDGELLDCTNYATLHERVYMTYDAVIVDGEYCGNWTLSKRLELIERNVVSPLWNNIRISESKGLPFAIKLKKFVQFRHLRSLSDLITRKKERCYIFDDRNPDSNLRQINGNDGVIFTAEDDNFLQKTKKNSLIKWKYLELCTVDLLVKHPFFSHSGTLQLYYGTKGDPEALWQSVSLSDDQKRSFLELVSDLSRAIVEFHPDLKYASASSGELESKNFVSTESGNPSSAYLESKSPGTPLKQSKLGDSESISEDLSSIGSELDDLSLTSSETGRSPPTNSNSVTESERENPPPSGSTYAPCSPTEARSRGSSPSTAEVKCPPISGSLLSTPTTSLSTPTGSLSTSTSSLSTSGSTLPTPSNSHCNWIPYLVRRDKVRPNFETTVKGVLRTIEEDVSLEQLLELCPLVVAKMDARPSVDVMKQRKRPRPTTREKYSGHVSRWVSNRGFGFIENANFPQNIFVHQTDVINSRNGIYSGDFVEFYIEKQRDGRLRAVDVKLISEYR